MCEDFVFSDPETYETVTLPPEIVGDAKNYLVENAQVTVTFVEDKAVTIELPSSVVLKVADAPEGVRGDSANNVQKASCWKPASPSRPRSSSRPARRSRWIPAPASTWSAPKRNTQPRAHLGCTGRARPSRRAGTDAPPRNAGDLPHD